MNTGIWPGIALVVGLMLSTISGAAGAAKGDNCWKTDVGPDLIIAACTDAIDDKKTSEENRGWAYNNRGYAWYEKGELDKAIADYDEAVRLNFTEAYTGRANAWFKKGDFDKSIADFDTAISISPNDAIPYNERGVVWGLRGEFDRAIADFDKAINLGSEKPAVAYDNRGHILALKGDSEGAIADFDEAISLDPKYALAYQHRGNIWLERGDVEKAAADYEKAIGLGGSNSYDYLFRGLSEFYRNSLPQALSDFQKAVELEPKNPYSALWLEIAERSVGGKGHLSEADLDLSVWPGPLIQLFLGRMSPEEARAAARSEDAYKQRGQLCEMDLYEAEWLRLRARAKEAEPLYEAARNDCPHTFTEWQAANWAPRAAAK